MSEQKMRCAVIDGIPQCDGSCMQEPQPCVELQGFAARHIAAQVDARNGNPQPLQQLTQEVIAEAALRAQIAGLTRRRTALETYVRDRMGSHAVDAAYQAIGIPAPTRRGGMIVGEDPRAPQDRWDAPDAGGDL